MPAAIAEIQRLSERRFLSLVKNSQFLEGEQRSRVPDIRKVFELVDRPGSSALKGSNGDGAAIGASVKFCCSIAASAYRRPPSPGKKFVC